MKSLWTGLGILGALTAGHGSALGDAEIAFDAEDALARSYAAYAALTAYADSGTVEIQTSGFRDRYTFRTYFTRQPKNLYLSFTYLGSEYNDGNILKNGRENVIWMENGTMQTYDTQAQEQETYTGEGARQVQALNNHGFRTKGVSVVVPSLIYTKSGLASVIQATEEAAAAGTETIDGRRCLKVMGVERWRYPSGQVTGVRQVTIWIDAETYLIRKIFQDTPKGMPRNAIDRQTTTYRPHANPALEARSFHYAVPES